VNNGVEPLDIPDLDLSYVLSDRRSRLHVGPESAILEQETVQTYDLVPSANQDRN
jgi:hypothetical protein